MKILGFILSVLLLNCFALSEKAKAGKFEAVYKDKLNGLSWGKRLPENYSNGCVDTDGLYDGSKCTSEKDASGNNVRDADGNLQVKVDDSNAAKACRDVGGRLPTKPEYDNLVRNFDHTEGELGPTLTAKGFTDIHTIFRDMTNTMFWSASLFPKVSDIGGGHCFFDGNGFSYGVDRNEHIPVRCVVQ